MFNVVNMIYVVICIKQNMGVNNLRISDNISRREHNRIHQLLTIIYNYSALDMALAWARTRLSYSTRFWLLIKIQIKNKLIQYLITKQ